ncbi:MAG: energy-coupling factor ABC transporter permease [Planctomycetes bacterium]|nr:energy-coupling factor ABC transporter permease [Planctomycetota bacterium]
MHMSDALISPVVGGTFWAATLGLTIYSARRISRDAQEIKAPLMGVLGAFVFAAQMINFQIPGTGSSGHIGGGLLLAILLGPEAAFLVMFSILAMQALIFADGGLLALGCNVFNMGFWTCFVAYPLVFRRIARETTSSAKLMFSAIVASMVGLQLGALFVVLETVFSGISELPFAGFSAFMLSIHAGIGLIEGIVTALLAAFVFRARPELLRIATVENKEGARSLTPLLWMFVALAIVTGGFLSWFASENPDGLEYSIFKVAGTEEIEGANGEFHESLANVQQATSVMPDYAFPKSDAASDASESVVAKSLPGIVGATIVLAIATLAGLAIRLTRRENRNLAQT